MYHRCTILCAHLLIAEPTGIPDGMYIMHQ